VTETRFFQAVEYSGRRGIPKVVQMHHAAMRIDSNAEVAKDRRTRTGTGFPRWHDDCRRARLVPNGHSLNVRQRRANFHIVRRKVFREGTAWQKTRYMASSNVHSRPGEKAETVQCSIGLFFTESSADEKRPSRSFLTHRRSIFPQREGLRRDRFVTLPVDVDLFAIFPHCHYLGKDLQGFATLPGWHNGKWLLPYQTVGL